MVKGMRAYDEKDRRKMRRRNHIVKDLQKTKYHQRVKEGHKPEDDFEHWTFQEWLKHLDEENEVDD